ncbi:MAG: hypothetical protein ACRDLV_09570, partial [Solirubrobacteraceae bacterium]
MPKLSIAHTAVARMEQRVDSGLEYRPREPVRVWVVRRGDRVSVSDRGGAVSAAGVAGEPGAWRQAARRVEPAPDVNLSRHGVISLPVVRAGPPETEVVARIARASLALYQ